MGKFVIDIESFYDSKDGYTLSKMTTEEYINDPRFKLFGFCVSKEGAPPIWVPGRKAKAVLDRLQLHKHTVICHNAAFDLAALTWHYGVRPKRIVDTLSMCRGLFGTIDSNSLAAVCERLGLGAKGGYIENMDGVRHLTPEIEAKLASYCKQDTALTWKLYETLAPQFPAVESVVVDLTVRMFTEPLFVLDAKCIDRELELAETRRTDLLEKAQCTLEDLRSDAKFANLLISLGVNPPKKLSEKRSAKKGEPVYVWAFAKNDADFKELLKHDNELVQWACEARMGLKSTIKESRAQRFKSIQERFGKLPIALDYYGAHTGRYAASKSASTNLQNLPAVRGSKDPDAGLLRKSMRAPEGYKVVVCDASQIEARFVAWLAGQDNLVESFAQGRDVYSEMASDIFNRHVDRKKNPDDYIPGFIGKCTVLGCIAEGELVLTDKGLVPIEKVTTFHRVWDGIEWVTHDGPIYQGEKEVITYDSLTATPDHIVFVRGGTTDFGTAASQKTPLTRTGDGGRPVREHGDCFYRDSPRQIEHPEAKGEVCPLCNREVDQHIQRQTGANKRLPEMQSTEAGAYVVGRPLHGDETTLHEPERPKLQELRGAGSGVQIRDSHISRVVGDGEPRATSGYGAGSDRQRRALRTGEPTVGYPKTELQQYPEVGAQGETRRVQDEVPTREVCRRHVEEPAQDHDIRADSGTMGPTLVQTKRRVWDLLNCGPRNRFTVSGRLVHNCGYGLGMFKFAQMMYAGMLGGPSVLFDMDMAEQLSVNVDRFASRIESNDEFAARIEEIRPAAIGQREWVVHCAVAQKIIRMYRDSNPMIAELWRTFDILIEAMYKGEELEFGPLKTGKNYILLPNQMRLQYRDLEVNEEGRYSYLRRKEGRVQRVGIYGGSAVENVTQALAGAYVKEAMARMWVKYNIRTILQVHDEVVAIVPEDKAEWALEKIMECMTTTPSWAKGLPLAAEGDVADSYGGAKG